MHRLGAFVIPFILLAVVFDASAQVMQSPSYRIQNDSINVGGGLGSSTNYVLESTAGEVATGRGSSTNYEVSAGYQGMQEAYLALSGAADVVLNPALGGITGGTSNGSTSVTVTTDNYAGYSLSITASSSPAMVSGSNVISDYVPAGANPDYTFAVGAGASVFAFSPEGADVSTRFLDNGIICGIDSGETTLSCWDGPSTTPVTIAQRTSANHPLGTNTLIRFRVGIGSAAMQAPGTYIATTTVTALPL